MKITQPEDSLSVQLSLQQLWYLAQFFAPGLIFGVEDPVGGLDEEARKAIETSVYESLNQAGVLEMEASGQFRMDEILGAMVYSCIHSSDMMFIKSNADEVQRYYHFLPEWQLELCQMEKGYQLTLFKKRSDLFSHILELSNISLHNGQAEFNLTFGERDLELAAFLYESGKKDRALEVLPGESEQQAQLEKFLQGYLKPELHLIFDMLNNRDDEIRVNSRRWEMLQTGDGLYWLSYGQAGEELLPYVEIESITPELAQERFSSMLPLDED